MMLHAYTYPYPNFHSSRIKDTNLAIFHPSLVNCHLVDDALLHLTDARVVADVHIIYAQINKKQNIKHQRLELDGELGSGNCKGITVLVFVCCLGELLVGHADKELPLYQ
jgi:hypothetical protein